MPNFLARIHNDYDRYGVILWVDRLHTGDTNNVTVLWFDSSLVEDYTVTEADQVFPNS